jgi:hypothetical protein
MPVNSRRVLIAALAGGMVWIIWTLLNEIVAEKYYLVEQAAGRLLKEPRYFFFRRLWVITVLLLAYIASWFYASVRATLGPGPGTALRVGVLLGFAISFPLNLSLAIWSPMSRIVPLLWVVDLWGGAILGTLVAGWIYRE